MGGSLKYFRFAKLIQNKERMEQAYVIDAIRTPVGKFGGALSSVRPDDMAAYVIKALIGRNPGIDIKDIEDVILGAANQAGEDNRNVARMALLMAGIPIETGGVTVNRLCASGLQAIMDASRGIRLSDGEVFIAGGTESMSRAPWVMAKSYSPFGRKPEVYDTTIGWRFTNPRLAEMYYPYAMGGTAENVAEQWGISREEQDRFSLHTQIKYQAAYEAGKFEAEILPISIKQRKGDPVIVDKDEHPRLSNIEKLNSLKPAFREKGTVTAGNSSGINDGAAALYLASENYIEKKGVSPMARVVSMAIAGVNPDCMGIGPVPATRKALDRAGLKIEDLGLIELNEAFASQSIACIKELGIDDSIVNVNGGSIAIGHPLGCSGARITTTLLHEMKRRKVKYGLATMCVGVGQGAAIIYENV